MEKISQAMEEQLLDYLDGRLGQADIQKLEQQLLTDKTLRARYHSLKNLHILLQQSETEQPARNFTDAVMGKLTYYPAGQFPVRNGILLLMGMLVSIGIVLVLLSTHAFDNIFTTVDLNKINLPKDYFPKALPTITFSGKMIVNIIIVANVALAWMMLDRVILKPLFRKRMGIRGHF